MALSAFTDKHHQPSEEALRLTLGEAHAAWTHLIELVANRITPLTPVWGFTGASTGWGLRLKRGERVIVYMTPRRGQFLVSFALGEKAVAAAKAAKLPALVLETIDAAPRYAEGRGARFVVSQTGEVAPLAVLAQLKSEH